MTDSVNPPRKTIAATKVPDHLRLSTLPRVLPNLFLVYENTIYDFAQKLLPSYQGGYWEFYDLDNGGFYMVLNSSKPLELAVPFGNDYKGVLSPDAASIVINLFTFAYLCEKHQSHLCRYLYEKLREFAYEHQEASEILAAID